MAVRRHTKTRRVRKRPVKPRTKVDKSLNRRITKLEHSREVKYIDGTFASVVNTSTPQAFSLVGAITRGDQYNERSGDVITSKKLKISYIITKTISGDTGQYRLILLWDKNFSGGGNFQIAMGPSPTVKEEACSLLDDRDGMVLINAPYNELTHGSRYTILYDKVHIINPDSTGVAVSLFKRKTFALSGAKIEYTNGGDEGVVEELVSRNLAMVFITAGSNDMGINYTGRYYYTDS